MEPPRPSAPAPGRKHTFKGETMLSKASYRLTLVLAAFCLLSLIVSTLRAQPDGDASTSTPIKHLVVIFQENVSFDHYFGTYPHAANTSGQPFSGAGDATVNGLANTPGVGGVGSLLTNNPNRDAAGHQVNPRRLDPANINDVLTCDQSHNYNTEQKAFDGGQMDKFVTTLGTATGTNG